MKHDPNSTSKDSYCTYLEWECSSVTVIVESWLMPCLSKCEAGMVFIRQCVRFINSIIVIYTIDTCANLLNQIDFAVDRRSGATLGKFSMSKQLAADVLVGELYVYI